MTLVGVAAAAALLRLFAPVLWPLAFAALLAIVVQACARAMARAWPRAHPDALLLTAGFATPSVALVAIAVVVVGASELAGDLPLLLRRVDDILRHASARLALEDPLTLRDLIGDVDARVLAGRLLSGLRVVLTGLLLTGLLLIFLLTSWPLIRRRVEAVVGGPETQAHLALARSVQAVEAYVWIQAATGLMNAAASGLIMFAAGLESWAFWALALFVLSFIPILGVALGSVVPALFALLQFPSAWPAVWVFLGIQATAFVVGNLVLPKLQAATQNIDPCAGLVALTGWSILWGIPGAFLAVPMTLALMHQLARSPHLSWIAVLISNDGEPLPDARRAAQGPRLRD